MPKPLAIEIPTNIENAPPFAVPADADVATLAATRESIRKNAERLLDKDKTIADKSTAQRIAEANWLLESLAAIDARTTEINAEREAEQATMDELRGKLGDPNGGDGEDDGTDDDDAGDAEDEHRDGDKPADQAGGNAGDQQQVAAPEPVLVASSAVARRRSAIADAARSGNGSTTQQMAPGQARSAYLTASTEVDGHRPGEKLDWAGMGKAAMSQFGNLPDAFGGDKYAKNRIGRVHVPTDPGLVASKMVAGADGRAYDLDDAIDWALSSKRLAQETGSDGSLVAAGGWCAPSETLYDLVDVTTDDGMVNIPGITVNRGGVRYALGPDFSAVYSAGANFTKTEAQAIAGSVKPVVNIPCPAFTDNRMLVDGLYLTGDILTAKGYPEAYADFTGKALKAFAHYVNKQTLADMEALCTAVNLVQGGSPPPYENTSVTTELLGAVELQVVDMRYRNRMSLTSLVEVVLPIWTKGTIRSDMAKRAAVSDPGGITDAMIENWFAIRGAAVQWVYDWQDFFATAAGLGAATAALAWPTTVKFMIYPQGGFVRALDDVIELSAVYDSVLLQTNQYVALFLEQARLTLKRVPDVRVCSVKVYVTGITGATVDYTAKQPTV